MNQKTIQKLNQSGLVPLGVAVLVQPYKPGDEKESSIYIPPTVAERTQMAETRAIVIEVGPYAWHDEPQPRAKPGDRVLISRFSGVLVIGTADSQQYRMINDRDIYCRIESEEKING